MKKTVSMIIFMIVAMNAAAQTATIRTFKLESLDRRNVYGPFEFRMGANVLVGDDTTTYVLKIESSSHFSLVKSDGDYKVGPYELAEGRIVDLKSGLYTVVNIRKRTVAYREEGAGREIPSVASDAAISARPIFRFPVAARTDNEWSLSYSAKESVTYRTDVDASAGSDMVIDRSRVTFGCDGPFLDFTLGMTTDAEWDESITGDGLTYREALLEDGSGWFATGRAHTRVFREGICSMGLFAGGGFSRESFSASYNAWTSIERLVTGTNGLERTSDWVYRDFSTDITVSEWWLETGLILALNADAWFCSGELKFLPIVSSTVDGGIDVAGTEYEIELERDAYISGKLSAGVKVVGDLFLFGDMELGSVDAFRVGIRY